jgi:hypothetical protein
MESPASCRGLIGEQNLDKGAALVNTPEMRTTAVNDRDGSEPNARLSMARWAACRVAGYSFRHRPGADLRGRSNPRGDLKMCDYRFHRLPSFLFKNIGPFPPLFAAARHLPPLRGGAVVASCGKVELASTRRYVVASGKF